jgi:hypothetical protein
MGVKASYPKFPKFSNKWMSNILLSFDRSVQLWNGESGMLSKQFLKSGILRPTDSRSGSMRIRRCRNPWTRVACPSEHGFGDQDNRS